MEYIQNNPQVIFYAIAAVLLIIAIVVFKKSIKTAIAIFLIAFAIGLLWPVFSGILSSQDIHIQKGSVKIHETVISFNSISTISKESNDDNVMYRFVMTDGSEHTVKVPKTIGVVLDAIFAIVKTIAGYGYKTGTSIEISLNEQAAPFLLKQPSKFYQKIRRDNIALLLRHAIR